MGFNFVPAAEVKQKSHAVIGISAPAKTGKTYTALYLAQLLARAAGKPVYMIDTDSGRGLKYADRPDVYPDLNPYLYLRLDPPHSSERYQEAIKAANSAGAGCIVVDTGSDEWDGDGGVLDQHEKRLDQLAGQDYKKREKSNMAGWAKVKPPHKRFAHSLTQLDAHLIICFRGEPKTEVGKDGKPRILGIQPVWGSAIPFKLDFHLHMNDKDRPGVYEPWFRGLKHETGIFPGGRVDAATVKRLLASYAGESPSSGPAVAPGAPAAAVATPPDPVNAEGSWVLKEVDGKRVYAHTSDPSTREAQKSIFRLFRTRFSMKDMTPEEKETALAIAEDNQHLIDGLPQVGRKQLNNLLQIIVQSQLAKEE